MHYDPKKELIIAADASEYGTGAVLLHKFGDRSTKPIVHASRSTTSREKLKPNQKRSSDHICHQKVSQVHTWQIICYKQTINHY